MDSDMDSQNTHDRVAAEAVGAMVVAPKGFPTRMAIRPNLSLLEEDDTAMATVEGVLDIPCCSVLCSAGTSTVDWATHQNSTLEVAAAPAAEVVEAVDLADTMGAATATTVAAAKLNNDVQTAVGGGSGCGTEFRSKYMAMKARTTRMTQELEQLRRAKEAAEVHLSKCSSFLETLAKESYTLQKVRTTLYDTRAPHGNRRAGTGCGLLSPYCAAVR